MSKSASGAKTLSQDQKRELAEKIRLKLLKRDENANPRTNPISLASLQESFFFLNEMNPADVSNNLFIVFKVIGLKDLSRFESSVSTLIRMVEPLRTTFKIENDRPAQIIGEPFQFKLNPEARGNQSKTTDEWV